LRPKYQIDDNAKESLKILLDTIQNKTDFLRIQCVWLRVELGFNSNIIARITGWAPGTVKKIWSNYLKNGEETLIGVGRGGRRRHYLTYEEEETFLEPFFNKSAAGNNVLVTEIKKAYEEKIEKTIPKSTIYRLLHRHGWKK
jgi:transposase